MSSSHFEVMIIGAGIAGLSAAQHLIKSGIKSVVVLEAQNRIGGRVYTAKYGSGHVELGANWIHGSNQANCIFNLANQYRLVETPLRIFNRKNGAFVGSSGEAIDQSLSEEIYDKINEIGYQTVGLKQETNNQTLKQFCDIRVQKLIDSYPPENTDLINSIYRYFINYMGFHAGDDIGSVSAWGYGAYNEIPNDIVVKGGYGGIIDRLIDEIGKHNIQLKHQVLQIDYTSIPIHMKVKTETTIELFTSNYVLMTTSLGVLKAYHKQLFTPQLPIEKTEAIDRMGFGKVGKIFLYYSNPFWTVGTLHNLKFVRNDDQYSDWTNRINGFEEVINNPNVIQAWISGKEVLDMENSDEQTVLDLCAQMLRKFTGDPSLPSPDSVLRTDWTSNPFIRGSYSYPTTKTRPNDHKLLSEAVLVKGEPRLLFAGEATHESYFSTVHGARLTGLIQANNIIKSVKTHELIKSKY